MKTRPLVLAAALAAMAGGVGGYATRGPDSGAIGVQDSISVEVFRAPESGGNKPGEDQLYGAGASPVPSPEETPVPEPLTECPAWDWGERQVVAFLDTRDLNLLFGTPESGYWIPPGKLDPRLVDGEQLLKKAGSMDLYANVKAELFDEDGVLRDVREGPNTIVTGGKTLALQMLVGAQSGSCPTTVAGGCGNNGLCSGSPKFNYVAVGTSSQTPVIGDTGLGGNGTTEVGTRVLQTAPTIVGGTATIGASFGTDNPAGSNTLNESGLFNASSSGTMLARKTFAGPLSKGANDVVQITWTITLN